MSDHKISLVGKYLVREGTSFDKKAYWYRNEGIPMAPTLKKESHTNFMIRANLKKRTVNNSTIEYPSTKDVPYGAKAMWRHDNVKLNVVCDIVESYQCDKQYSKIKLFRARRKPRGGHCKRNKRRNRTRLRGGQASWCL